MSTAIARNFQIGIDPTPTNNFTLYQPATPDGTLRLGNGNTGITSSLLTLTSAGNLGIGNTAPGYRLDVAAADTTAGVGYGVRIRANAVAGAGALQFTDNPVSTQYGLISFGVNGVGIIQSDGASGRIEFRTNGSERARIDASGNLGIGTSSPATRLDVNGTATTTALTVNGNNISAVNSLGFRNRIINGDMRIDQRNNGGSVNSSGGGTFSVDRFTSFGAGGGVYTTQRSTDVPAGQGFVNSIVSTVTTTDSPTGTDYYLLTQAIEGFNIADLGWGTASARTVTISFWVKASLTGTYTVALRNSALNRSYRATYTINSANTWEQKTITVAGDTTGTWLTDNGTGIRLGFTLGAGSDFIDTGNVWSALEDFAATGQTQWIATSGATFYLTGVQLEAGSVATPFERRDYGRELIMCQRYFQRWDYSATLGTAGASAFAATKFATTDAALANFSLTTTMRAVPTMTTTASQGRLVLNSAVSFATITSIICNQATGSATVTLINNSITPGFGWLDGFGIVSASAEL